MYRPKSLSMPNKQSKWKIVAELGLPDNGSLSVDQEQAEHSYIDMLAKQEAEAGARFPDETLMSILMSKDEGLSQLQAAEIVSNYRNNPRVQQQTVTEIPESAVPEIENPISQEDVLNIDSTVDPSAPAPNPLMTQAKYVGEHKKKKKKGDKRHLKGTGPKADKANEVYHAIMRDRDGKGEPTKEEQASAAAIAWSQAKKTMKKKAYFRGEEAKVLDAYRGMWGEDLVRVSVNGQTIDVPRESIEFVSTEVIDPVEELKNFIANIPEEAETKSQIKANIQNLKTAKEIAYRIVVEGSADLSGNEEIAIDAIHTSCERRIKDLEEHLASSMTDFDADYIEALPKYEIGTEVFASDFSQDQGGWMDEVIEKMAADAEGIDINKLAQEDPLVFVAGLSADIIANATAVKNLAMERVESAAGPLDSETKEWVVSTYIEITENARRKALSHLRAVSHEEVQEQHKTANSVPDEGLFL